MSRRLSEHALPDFSQLLHRQPQFDAQQLDADRRVGDRALVGGELSAREQIENAAHNGPLMHAGDCDGGAWLLSSESGGEYSGEGQVAR